MIIRHSEAHAGVGAYTATGSRITNALADMLATIPAWMNEGLCAQTDPEAFFPDKGGTPRPAKAICAECPVRAQCLEYAVENGERYGVWGGTTDKERRRIREAREAA